MKPSQKLSGWLFLAVSYTVKSVQRGQRRRRHYERLAAMERNETTEDRPPLAGELDGAVAQLPHNYRDAVLLRFYRGLEISAMAQLLNISEAATRKRIERGIGLLRGRLGAAASADALATAALFGAPRNLITLCANLTRGGLGAGSVSAGASLAAKGAGSLMAAAKLKLAIAILLLVFLAGGAATLSVWYYATTPSPAPAAAPVAAIPEAIPKAALASDQQILQQTYGLRPGEIIRWVKPPFIKQRPMLYIPNGFTPANGWKEAPSCLGLWYTGPAKFALFSIGFPVGAHWTPSSLAENLLRDNRDLFCDFEIEGDKPILDTYLAGDFVFTLRANNQQYEDAIRQIVLEATGAPITISIRNVNRPVIVFRGTWKADAGRSRARKIEIYGLALGADPKAAEGDRQISRSGFDDEVGSWINEQVVFEAKGVPSTIYDCINGGDGTAAGKAHAHDRKLVCDHIAEQTGLTWTEESRSVPRVFIERKK